MEGIQWSLCVLLAALALKDHKNRKISVWPIIAALCIGILNLYLQNYGEWKSALGGMSMGFALCALSKISENGIGTGDGLVIAVIGMYMGAKFTFFCMTAAFLLASLSALGLLCIKKAGKHYKIPFIPYIFAAYIITICIQMGERG